MSNTVAVSNAFSAKITRNLANNIDPQGIIRLAELGGFPIENTELNTIGDLLNIFYKALSKPGVRDDYIFRSNIIQKIVLGRHSLATTAVLNEFRVGNSKADLGVINGTLTGYEIKSDRDNLNRLNSQVEDYKKFFRKMYVVASSSQIEGIVEVIPSEIGVLELTSRQTLRTIKESSELLEFNSPTAIASSLRVSECFTVLDKLGVKVPRMPNSEHRVFIAEKFISIDRRLLSDVVRTTLLETRSQAHLADVVVQYPKFLRSQALLVLKNESDCMKYLQALSKEIKECTSPTCAESNMNLSLCGI